MRVCYLAFIFLVIAKVCFAQDAAVPRTIQVNEQFFYSVSGCVRAATKDASVSKEIRLFREGSDVGFVHRLWLYCSGDKGMTLESVVKDDAIEIREVFDGKDVAKCMCPIELKGTIKGLVPGRRYQVTFIFENQYVVHERFHTWGPISFVLPEDQTRPLEFSEVPPMKVSD